MKAVQDKFLKDNNITKSKVTVAQAQKIVELVNKDPTVKIVNAAVKAEVDAAADAGNTAFAAAKKAGLSDEKAKEAAIAAGKDAAPAKRDKLNVAAEKAAEKKKK